MKLSNMNNAERATDGWTGRRVFFRAVQIMMLAYGAREAARFMRKLFTKP